MNFLLAVVVPLQSLGVVDVRGTEIVNETY